jgi:predicted nuclease of predicted toxin-antitoxin system
VAERIRFHLDENVDPDIARALRRYGIDVTTAVEAGLRTRNDAAQWAFVREEGRVLVPTMQTFYALSVVTLSIPELHTATKRLVLLGT